MAEKEWLNIEEIVDLAMQDTVPFKAISDQFGMTADEVVAIMRKHLSSHSYKRWKERRGLPAFRKQSSEKPQKHRVRST
jgi:uncharacterized protein (TIGR03643 family)